MSITKKQIINAVAEMSVMDVLELISMMEEKFGIDAVTALNTQTTNGSIPEETIEEKTEFDVVLNAIGTNKVAVIKTVRSSTSLGLKEAKDLVESAPVTIKSGMSKDEAEMLKKILEEAGASVSLK